MNTPTRTPMTNEHAGTGEEKLMSNFNILKPAVFKTFDVSQKLDLQLRQLAAAARHSEEDVASLIFYVVGKFDGKKACKETLCSIIEALSLVLPETIAPVKLEFPASPSLTLYMAVEDGFLQGKMKVLAGDTFVHKSKIIAL